MRFGRNCDMTPVTTPTSANHPGPEVSSARSTAVMKMRMAVRNSTVQIASEDCVDAYTVLNENAPSSSAAIDAVAAIELERRASRKTAE